MPRGDDSEAAEDPYGRQIGAICGNLAGPDRSKGFWNGDQEDGRDEAGLGGARARAPTLFRDGRLT